MKQLHKWRETAHFSSEQVGMKCDSRERTTPGIWILFAFILLPMLSGTSVIAQTISGATSVCAGQATALSYATTGGSWSSSNTGVAVVSPTSGSVTGISAGTATISYTLLTATTTVVITVNSLPDPGTISGATDVCVQQSDTLHHTGSSGVWSTNNGIVTIGSSSGVVSGVSIGAGTLKYTVSNGTCSNSVTANINVNGLVGDIYTFGGTGVLGFSGDGGPAFLAKMGDPRDLFVDTATGSLYFCDPTNNRVRKITRSGIISTVAGNGTAGSSGDGLQATAATLNAANGVFVDHAGNIFISNTVGRTIRKVDPTGIITTIAGTPGVSGNSGDGFAATAAHITSPLGIIEDAAGNVYFADQINNCVRKIDAATGIIHTVVGSNSGVAGYSGDNGQATDARVWGVRGLTMDNSGNIYIADGNNNVIRKYVPATGIITTIAGNGTAGHTGDGFPATAATLTTPARFAYDGANILYLSDQNNNVVRQINLATGIISQVAGNATAGYTGDYHNALTAQLNTPAGIAGDHFGHFYIADAGNNVIRVVPSMGSIAASILGPTTVCAGTPVSFSAFLSSSGSPSYQWQKNGLPVSSGPTYTNPSPANGDVYRCIVTVTPGCSDAFNDTSNNITVTVLYPAAITGGSTTIYPGQTTTLTSPAVGGTWSSSNTAVATIDASGVLSAVSTGTTTITYNVTNLCGTSTANVTVTVNPIDVITAAAGPHGTMSPTGSVGVPGGNETFTMIPDAGYHVADVLVDGVSVGPVGSYTFTSITGPHTISVSFAPDCASPVITVCPGNVTVGSDAGACGAVVTYAGATVTGSSVTTTYSQNSGTFFPAGTTTVTVTAGNTCGSASCSFNVTVNPNALTVGIGSADITCHGSNDGAIITSVSGGVGSYTYSWTGGASGASPSGLAAGTYSVTVSDAGCSAETPVSASVTITEPAMVTAAASAGTITCNGGTTPVTVTGTGLGVLSGTGTFTVSAGTYAYSVSDINGCSASTSVTITEPTLVTASATAGAIACYGGSATVTITGAGGTGAFTGTGTPIVSAGTHTYVVADANGCTATTFATLTEPTQVIISAIAGTVTCHGGTTTVTVAGSGGTGTLSGTGVFTVGAGTYTYTVADENGCFATASVTIADPTQVTATATAGTISCNGEMTTITVTGTGDGTLSGAGSFPATAGTYNYTVSDLNGCSATTSITLTEPTLVVASATTGTIGCNGGSATVVITGTGGTGALSGTGSPTATAGTHTYIVTDANGCAASTSVTIVQPSIVTASASAGTITCHGGTTTVTVAGTGGTGTLSGTGVFTVGAGTHTYTVTDDNGCSATTSVTIADPTLVTATATAGTISCNGGSTTISVLGTGDGSLSGTGTFTVNAGTYTYTVSDINGCSATVSVVVTAPAAVTATATAGAIACNGGSTTVTITAAGGTGTLTGTGTPTVSAGTHTYVITDANGCSATTSVTIAEPTLVTASASAGTIAVHGGTTTVTIAGTGGTGSLSGTGSFIVGAGTYAYTVSDANGCAASTSVTINDPAIVVASATAGTISCNGGTTTVTVTGSGGIGTISGTGTFTVNAGTYTYTVSDANGGTATTTVTVAQPALVTATATAGTILCNGGSTTVTIVGAGGTGALSGTGTPTASVGTHTYIVADANGCTATTSVTIAQPTTVTASASAGAITCNGGTTTVTVAGSGGTGTLVGTGVFTVGAGTFTYTVHDANGCSATTSVTIAQPAPVTASAIGGTISCHGGTATMTVTGSGAGILTGTGTYTVSAGAYSYIVSDANGCSATAAAVVLQPSAVTASATAGPILCNGGSTAVTITGAGGTGPLTGITTPAPSVTAGSYSYTVTDANGCTATASLTVTQPSAVTASASAGNISCHGGTTTVTVTGAGGTGTLTGPGIHTVSAGTYTYTVHDANGCSATTSVTITEPAPISVTGTVTNVSCHGGADGGISLSVTGGVAGYTYVWSVGATASLLIGRTASTYSVTVTDANGCTAVRTYTVTEPALALSVGGTVTNSACGGASGAISLTVTGGTPGYTYLWSNASITSIITGLAAGTFSVTVTDAHGCSGGITLSVGAGVAPACSITILPDLGFLLTGGNDHNIYIGYGPQHATITADALLGLGLTYHWSPATFLSCTTCQSPVFTPTVGGNYTYTVTVTNASGCTSTCTVSFCVVDVRDPAHPGKVLLVHFPPGHPSNPQTISIGVAAVPAHLAAHDGDYVGFVGAGGTCGSSGGREAAPIGSAQPMESTLSVNAYPNPFNDDLHLKIESNLYDQADVIIYDLTGRVIQILKDQPVGTELTTGRGLISGMYLVEVKSGELSDRIKVVKTN